MVSLLGAVRSAAAGAGNFSNIEPSWNEKRGSANAPPSLGALDGAQVVRRLLAAAAILDQLDTLQVGDGTLAGDTGDPASVKAVAERALAALGRIDILVNNAAKPGGMVRDFADAYDTPEADVRRLMRRVAKIGRVVEIAQDQYFLRPVVAEMIGIAHGFGREFTAAEFRDKLDNGRKVAILILEFFDRHGVTVRKGDLRRTVPQKLEQFGPLVAPSTDAPTAAPAAA